MAKPQKYIDSKGNEFRSIAEASRFYGKDPSAVAERRKRGMSLQEAVEGRDLNLNPVTVDHLGNKFESTDSMCAYYGITTSAFVTRIKRYGWTLEDALTTPLAYRKRKKNYTDHKGNVFNSFSEMCTFYGKTRDLVDSRIKRGWSIEDALTKDKSVRFIGCEDHLGNRFDKLVDMCNAYGVSYDEFRYRIKNGWSVKDALTVKTVDKNLPYRNCVDHLGNEYGSLVEMCNYWGISSSAFKHRIKSGWELKKALETPLRKRK